MPESKFDFQIICPTRNPNNEFRKLAEKKVFERKQEKQKEKDQETQAIGIVEMTFFHYNNFIQKKFPEFSLTIMIIMLLAVEIMKCIQIHEIESKKETFKKKLFFKNESIL